MIVRRATESDIPVIVQAGEKFFNEAGFSEFLKFNNTTVEQLARVAVSDENYGVFVVEDDGIIGLAAGILYPFFFNSDHIPGQDFLWWVEPTVRGQKAGLLLFNALEGWAEKNADSFMMMSLERMKPEQVGKFYERRGYELIEHSYLRRF